MEKCETPLEVFISVRKRTTGWGENVEDLDCELENQRSAAQTLLDSVLGENLEDLPQQPRSVQNLHHGYTTSASCSTLHCWTFSCGPRGSPSQTGWPGTAGLSLVQLDELWLGRRGLLTPWRLVLVLVLLPPGPCHRLSLWS